MLWDDWSASIGLDRVVREKGTNWNCLSKQSRRAKIRQWEWGRARIDELVSTGTRILDPMWLEASCSWWPNSKESPCNSGHLGSIPGLGRSPGEGNGDPLQYSCLENPHGQRRLVGYRSWGPKSQKWLSNWARTSLWKKIKKIWDTISSGRSDTSSMNKCYHW